MDQEQLIRTENSEPHSHPAGDNLDAYRCIVELQKQVIELVKHGEQSRREYELLREQAVRDGTGGDSKSGPARRFFGIGARFFRAMETGVTIRHKQKSSPP
jgi:hypothetical protein